MGDKAIVKTSGVVFLVIAISLVMFSSEVNSEVIPEVVSFDESKLYIDTAPGSASTAVANVTVRSPFRERTEFRIDTVIEGGTFWSAQHPDSIIIAPLGQKQFSIDVKAPYSEEAGKSVTLNVIIEAENDKGEWEDRIDVEVLPFVRLNMYTKTEYLIDNPKIGSFNITLENGGNDRYPVALDLTTTGGIRQIEEVLLSQNEKRTVEIPYDMSGEEEEVRWKLVPSVPNTNLENSLEIRFIPEGELVHLLFDVDAVMVLLPAPLDDNTDFRLLVLGGEITDTGIEITDPVGGVEVRYDIPEKLSNLDRIPVDLKAIGPGGLDLVTVRAYGYHDGEKVESNRVPVPVEEEVTQGGGVDTGMIIRGSAVGGAGLLVGLTAYLYAASEVFRYKWLAILFIPLYTAIRKEKVLDHFFRGRLYEYIKENPGITYTALKKHFEVNNGTLTYHLHKLEKEEILAHRNVGKYKLFYPDGVKMRGADVVISVLDKEILEIVSDNPGITTAGIISDLKGTRSKRTLSRHIKDLERKQLIEIRKDGGDRRAYLSEGWDKVILSSKGVTDMREDLSIDV